MVDKVFLPNIPPRRWKRLVLSVLFYFIAVFSLPASCLAYKIGEVEVKPSFLIRETYSDNITYAASKTKSDFITTLGMGLSAKYEEKNRSANLAAHLNRDFFERHNNFDNTYEDLSLNLGQEFSKYSRVSLNDTFSHSEEPRSFEDEFGRAAGRYSTYRNRLSIDYNRELTRQISLLARYGLETTQYTRKDLSDSFLNSIGLESDYALSSMTVMFLSYDFARRDFDPGADASTRTAASGIRQYLNSQLFLDTKVGVNFVKAYNNQRYQKPLFSAALTNDIDENTSTKVSFKKEYYANAYSSDIFNYWELSSALTRRLSERLSGAISCFYGQGKYVTFGIKDKLGGLNMGISYDLSKNVLANLDYAYSETESNTEGREYQKNTVSAGLRVGF